MIDIYEIKNRKKVEVQMAHKKYCSFWKGFFFSFLFNRSHMFHCKYTHFLFLLQNKQNSEFWEKPSQWRKTDSLEEQSKNKQGHLQTSMSLFQCDDV